MFARNLLAGAALALAAAAALPAQAADAPALPTKITLLDVDTRDCRDGGSSAEILTLQARNCPFLGNMPESRLIPRIRTRVSAVLCPKVETTNPETGKTSRTAQCRTRLSVRDINNLSDYQVVSLGAQLGVRY